MVCFFLAINLNVCVFKSTQTNRRYSFRYTATNVLTLVFDSLELGVAQSFLEDTVFDTVESDLKTFPIQ